MKNSVLLLSFLLLIFLLAVSGSKVLMVMGAGTKSHTFIFKGIAEALVEGGHEVTFISPYSSSEKTENITEVTFNNDWNDKFLNMTKFEKSIFQSILNYLSFSVDSCLEGIQEMEEIINKKYDIVFISLFFSECYMLVPYTQKIPFIFISPNTLLGYYSTIFGTVDFFSFTPNKLFNAVHPMSFFERLRNALALLMFDPFMIQELKRLDYNCKMSGICSPDMPSFTQIQLNASFAFINSVRALEVPARPMTPNVIYIGGVHIKSPKALPKVLADFIDGSGENGFIFFSLGSNFYSSAMREEHRLILIEVFKSLDQRILWKWDKDEMEDLPSNVMLTKWVPQLDVLAHPKIRLFITHGGLFSIEEAAWFGVPMLGLPVRADQIGNMVEVASEGSGKYLQWDELTLESLNKTTREVMYDEEISRICKHRSGLMKDQQNSPADQVRYWTDYTIRYNGAKHLQSPIATMPWYKIYNMDVWAFVILVLLTIVTCIFIAMKKLLYFLCCRSRSQRKAVTQKTKNE